MLGVHLQHSSLQCVSSLCDGLQAFINTARKIYEKIEQGVFDVSNEVRALLTPMLHARA